MKAPWRWIVYNHHRLVVDRGVWWRGGTAEEVADEQIAARLWQAAPHYGRLSGMVCRAWHVDAPDRWVESRADEWLVLLRRPAA